MSVKKEKYNDTFTYAMQLREQQRYNEAIVLLKSLIGKDFHQAGVHGMIGGIYRYKKDSLSSIPYLKEATKLGTNSRLASIMLVHSLLETGEKEKALEELDRYLRACNSKKPEKSDDHHAVREELLRNWNEFDRLYS